MDLQSLLSPERTAYYQDVSSRTVVLERLSHLICQGLSDETLQATVFEAYVARERLGSTALEHGVAIQHIRAACVHAPMIALIRLQDPISYDGSHHQVDLIMGLAVPEEAHTEHLIILAAIARLFRQQSVRRRLRDAHDSESLYQSLFVESHATI